ncbi:MAG TPA: TlpA family protein disulfide reductase [Nitrospirae bacterium]|nr:TlpA family protein disulfide reductase [Nitrospirota bacterium]HDY71126.1 TlpA family protein disulfide reductase [Nitrospirota bacterium]
MRENRLRQEERLKVRTPVLSVALLLILLSCKAGVSGPAKVGRQAPSFSLDDIEGRSVSLSDYRNKVVLLEFWATWCPSCRKSVPEMEAISIVFIDKDFVLIGINMDEGGDAKERVRAFVQRYNISYTIVTDNGAVSRSYGVSSIPAIFLLDRNHRIRKKYEGFMPGMGSELTRQVESLL